MMMNNMMSKLKTILKYFFWYFVLLVPGYAFATLCTMALFYPLLEFIDWIFNINLVDTFGYYFKATITTGPLYLYWFKLWLLGIPFTYFLRVRKRGWKII